jgi:hypothetical protein
MQYELPTVSKITIRSDWPTGGSLTRRGANLDSFGFNVKFILERRPKMAVELFRLWRQASALREDDPLAPEEDYRLAEAELAQLVKASDL